MQEDEARGSGVLIPFPTPQEVGECRELGSGAGGGGVGHDTREELLCQHPSSVPHPKLLIIALGALLRRSLMSKFQRKKRVSFQTSKEANALPRLPPARHPATCFPGHPLTIQLPSLPNLGPAAVWGLNGLGSWKDLQGLPSLGLSHDREEKSIRKVKQQGVAIRSFTNAQAD